MATPSKLEVLNQAIRTGRANFLTSFPSEASEPQWVTENPGQRYPHPHSDMVLAVAVLDEAREKTTHIFASQDYVEQNEEAFQADIDFGIEVIKVDPSMLTSAMLFDS